MQGRVSARSAGLLVLAVLTAGTGLFAQRTGYSNEEFSRRRRALMDKVENGVILLFGESLPQAGTHFRQDNDFFYFTGVEDPGAVLLMAPGTRESFLFLPRQTPREIMIEGPNLLERPGEAPGFAAIHPVDYLDEFLARTLPGRGLALHVRLSPGDSVDNARWETGIFAARARRCHYNDRLSADQHRVVELKKLYPMCAFRDIIPAIDALRLIKTPEEIEIMRRNGRISAEAVRRAMLASRPGAFEYEVEAAAVHHILRNGCQGLAFTPIVGSGPNSCVWHYSRNGRRMREGEVVLMDFGGDLDYTCMDISRTWPVDGRFTPEQRAAYRTALTVQKACIEAYRPGVTAEDVRRHVGRVLEREGIDPRGLTGGIGHYVGMATHDVGPRGIPLSEGMVFAIEPGLYYPEQGFGIRIEDTVLITAEGCEVLTAGVPKEIEEIESLLRSR